MFEFAACGIDSFHILMPLAKIAWECGFIARSDAVFWVARPLSFVQSVTIVARMTSKKVPNSTGETRILKIMNGLTWLVARTAQNEWVLVLLV